MMTRTWPRLAAVLLLTGSSLSVHAQAPDTQLLYELLDRLQLLEQEIRQMRGELEVFRHQQSQGVDANAYRALEQRLQVLEQHLATLAPATAASTTPPTTPVQEPTLREPALEEPVLEEPARVNTPTAAPTPSAPPAASEQATYDAAFAHLRDGQYAAAVTAFQAFLRDYPSSALADNAQYWIGEAHYVTRDFEDAKQTFLNLGAQYPQSDKLPDTLLKLGYVYEALGDPTKARQVYEKLIQVYPGSQPAQQAQGRLTALR